MPADPTGRSAAGGVKNHSGLKDHSFGLFFDPWMAPAWPPWRQDGLDGTLWPSLTQTRLVDGGIA